MTDPYENLANAIITTAAKDYMAALKTLKRSPSSSTALDTVREVERFFRSPWYQALTTVDGEFLIKKLKEEIR